MDISMLLGRYTGELAAESKLDHLAGSYQELLQMDGIAFPNAELQTSLNQWDAYAANLRGERQLNDDGTEVDMTGFDRDAVGARFQTDRLPIANVSRLKTLVDFGLISQAGSLAIARTAEVQSQDSPHVDALQRLNEYFKHFVQIGLSVEEWAEPWQQLVADGFEGDSLQFPLDSGGIRYASRILHIEPFDNLRKAHFAKLFHLGFNTLNRLSSLQSSDTEWEHQQLAAGVGVFYRQSPEGCDQLLGELVEEGRLAAGIPWQADVHAAVERASRSLED